MESTYKAHVPDRTGGFRPKEYAHVVLKTPQPDVLIDWYSKVLGLKVVMRHPGINFLTWDDSQDRMAIVPMAEAVAPPENAHGLHHVAFEVGSVRELVDQYRALKDQGITPVESINHGVATSMYYVDPDGNRIELSVEAFKSVEALNEWFGTGLFDKNPLGVHIDPEELCARVDAGEAEEEILKPHPRHEVYLEELTEKPASLRS